MFLSSVIHAFVDQLFAGMEINGCYQFRVTRNSDLFIDDEDVDDLKHALEGELFESRYGAAVRLETAHDCSDELATYLLEHFQLSPADLYQVLGPVNLNRLLAVYDLVDRPDLKYPPFTPGVPKQLVNMSLFEAISKRDILLHHPYESFAPVIDFIYRAANDPDVLAIKQTLYRTTPDSPLAESLVSAAKAGKEVTVLIELRARFDEAANIALASKLQEAGAHVVYGVVGYKTHCKMALVVRREGGRLKRYVHLGTGNYHPRTARAYTDYGLLSANEALGEDVHQVFMQLTSLMKTPQLKLLSQSPFNLHDRLLAMIRRETRNAGAGKTARIIAKINALVEPEIIRALYEASNAGVAVDLIVRGICCLRPGVPGVSENIRVRSIVGRFLEHSRCYCFHNGGDEEIYCASADWMDRNFFRRIELMFPIRDETLKARIRADLAVYLADNVQAWELHADGTYERFARQRDQEPNPAQATAAAAARRNVLSTGRADHTQLEPASRQPRLVLLQIRDGQRIEIEPAFGEPHLERVAARREHDRRQLHGAARPVQQHREPQQHDQLEQRRAPRVRHAFEERVVELAAVECHERRQERLLEAHEPRHVRVGEQIAAVVVIARVRDVEPDLMQARSPNEQAAGSARRRASSSASPARAIAPPWLRRVVPDLCRRDSDAASLGSSAHARLGDATGRACRTANLRAARRC